MLQNYKGFTALVILAVFSLWMLKHTPEVIEVKQLEKSEHDVDYFSVGYTKLQMDEFGLPSNKLFADYVVHYRDSAEVKLINPVNIIFKVSAPPWVVSSEEGILADSGDTLFLKGYVNIKRKSAEGVQQVDIQTRNLMMEPKKQFAETAEWAEMVIGQDTISGIGMKLFYESPVRIELLSKVRGLHVYN